MKTKQKLKIAVEEFKNLDTEYSNELEGIMMGIRAMEHLSKIIDLQRLRIAELEEDNSTLVDKVERLEENIQVLLNAR
jgi:Ran GTPase-activating protein (RanGAP) involved in mRNA processing and transport